MKGNFLFAEAEDTRCIMRPPLLLKTINSVAFTTQGKPAEHTTFQRCAAVPNGVPERETDGALKLHLDRKSVV